MIHQTRLKLALITVLLAGSAGLPLSIGLGQSGTVDVNAQMVGISGGAYPTGTDRGGADARPAHLVTLEPFWIDRFEVTNEQFIGFLEAVLADRSRDIRLVGNAAPGTADARVIKGADAKLLMENVPAPNRRTLVALNDEQSRIGVKDGRLVIQPGFEKHPVNEVTWYGARVLRLEGVAPPHRSRVGGGGAGARGSCLSVGQSATDPGAGDFRA